ncbi:MAG: hypothetical protein E6Q61_08060 [Nitrosomonas sp.]|nr:MAG: hypothetical protein E6Q61_08060 [Nitrosomonas sp.]
MLDMMPELVQSLKRMTSLSKFRKLWQESKVITIGTILGFIFLVVSILGIVAKLLYTIGVAP